jgi:hypothetical protein
LALQPHKDSFVILRSDGLWDVLSDTDAVATAAAALKVRVCVCVFAEVEGFLGLSGQFSRQYSGQCGVRRAVGRV